MLGYPTHLDIESTNHCQLSCVFCPHRLMKREKGFMDFRLFKLLVRESAGRSKTCYLHQIGEPFLHPQIIDMINCSVEAGIKTSVSTNCVNLDEGLSNEILKTNLDEITLCLDSLNKMDFENMRVGANFEKVLNNITKFLELRVLSKKSTPLVEIQLIKNKFNNGEEQKIKDMFQNMLKDVPHRWNFKGFSNFAGRIYDLSRVKQIIRRFTCKKHNTHMTINWDGTVVVCCRDFDKHHVLGNLNEQNVVEVWTGEQFMKVREGFKNKEYPFFCKDC